MASTAYVDLTKLAPGASPIFFRRDRECQSPDDLDPYTDRVEPFGGLRPVQLKTQSQLRHEALCMPIKPSDAQKLWGRAGGRCSICRATLSHVSVDGVLGEIAHIVGRAPSGPRGDDPLPPSQRDGYSNLILLCPNHHTEIDHDVSSWTVSRLVQSKGSHETWIQEQLDRGLAGPAIRTSQPFRESRVDWWSGRDERTWLYAALTPLEVADGVVDTNDPHVGRCLSSLSLSPYLAGRSGDRPNWYHVEPAADGVALEEFRDVEAGIGYRVEVFRTGHVEAAVLLDRLIESGVDGLSDIERRFAFEGVSDHRLGQCRSLLGYHHFAEAMEFCAHSLFRLKSELPLPFGDMVFTLALFGEVGLGLAVERSRDRLVGRALENRRTVYEMIVGGDVGADEALVASAGRIVNAFGFTLSRFRGDDRKLILPKKPEYSPSRS